MPVRDVLARPAWTVLLIGGNSGAGKTTVANAIGRLLGVNVAQADTYRLIVERVAVANGRLAEMDAPTTAEACCAALRARAEALHPMLEVVTAYHVATRAPLILEGDCLVPAFAVNRLHAYVPVAKQLRAVFVLDRNRDFLLRKQRRRGRGFTLLAPERQALHVDGDLRYADWLHDEALAHGCAVLEPPEEQSVDDIAHQIIGQLDLARLPEPAAQRSTGAR